MDFTYVTWGSGEIVVQALRSLAIIVGSGGLTGVLQVSALLGILILSANAAFNISMASATAPLKLLLVIVVCGGVLFLPTRVTVEDRFDGQDLLSSGGRITVGPVVVANVPLGVALPMSVFSLVGSSLTRLLETAMNQVDAESRLSSAGLWLSARSLKAMARDATLRDSTLAGDFRYYMENCTYFDMLADRVSLGDLRTGSPMAELARSTGGLTSVTSESGGLLLVSCGVAWSGGVTQEGVQVVGLSQRIRNEGVSRKFEACQSLRGIALAMEDAQLRQAMLEAQDPTVGTAALCGDTVFSHAMDRFGFEGSVSDQFADLVAIGLLRDGATALSAQDPRAVALGRFTAQRQRDATYVVAGELAAVALPALRGLLETAVMVLLPILFVIGLLFFEQFGRYLTNGLVLVIWLHLWPPVMTVFNNVGEWVQVAAMHEHVILSNGRFTVAGIEGALAELDTQLALSRYMLVLVPMVAWALVRAGEFSGALLAGRLMQPSEQAAGHVSSSVATNNWSMDQVQMTPRTSVGPHIASIGDPWGGTVTRYDQLSTMSMPANEPGYVSATQSRTVTEALRRSSEESRINEQQARSQFSRSVESAFESAFGTQGTEALGVLRNSGVSDSTSYRALEASGEVMRQAESKSRSVSQSEGSEHTWKMGFSGEIGSDFFQTVAASRFHLDSSQHQKVGVSEGMRLGYDQLDEKSKSAIEEVSSVLQENEQVSASTSSTRINSEGHKAAMREASGDLESYEQAQKRASKLALASEQATTSSQAVVQELARDPQNAKLLSEMHRLHIVEGMEFEQAWERAQETSGVRLDIDSVAARLLGEQIPPMQFVTPSPTAIADQHDSDRQMVERAGQGGLAQPGEIPATSDGIESAQERLEGSELPPPSQEHYQEDRVIHRTVRGPDGEPVMVVQGRSMMDMGNSRINEIFAHLVGIEEIKPDEQDEGKSRDK